MRYMIYVTRNIYTRTYTGDSLRPEILEEDNPPCSQSASEPQQPQLRGKVFTIRVRPPHAPLRAGQKARGETRPDLAASLGALSAGGGLTPAASPRLRDPGRRGPPWAAAAAGHPAGPRGGGRRPGGAGSCRIRGEPRPRRSRCRRRRRCRCRPGRGRRSRGCSARPGVPPPMTAALRCAAPLRPLR